MTTPLPPLSLNGVDHTAFPTAKPKETIEFYRDVLRLPVLHAITAKGWGWKNGYPDFFHFFFDAGRGSTIAFFYHIGSPPLPRPENPFGYQAQARHTAWSVETDEEMIAWHTRLKAKGVKVTPQIRHELIESIYFLDPNDYPLEITRRLRDLTPLDKSDAERSLMAIAETFGPNPEGGTITGRSIEDMWRLKARLVRDTYGFHQIDPTAPAIYVPCLPEYRPLIDYADRSDLMLTPIGDDYVCVSAPGLLKLSRADVKLDEALWFSMLVGGLNGEVSEFTTETLSITASTSIAAMEPS